MKAAVLEALENIVVKEVETPRVVPESILVRVRACAVCGSDLRIFHHGNPRVKPPQIIGHEIAGDVVDVGETVEGFRVGQRVAIGADVPCGVCEFCRAGIGNNCQINYAIGYQFPGGFAEYILLNETTVKYGPIHEIPENLDYETAALAEPLGCCVHGLELVGVAPGETVVIIGAGPAGCLLAQLARHMGATKIIVAQRSPGRLEIAKQFDIDVAVPTQTEDLKERVMEETDGLGADVIITACASPEAQMQAIELAKNRGRINYFGGLPKGSPKLEIDSNIIHYRELIVT
ncbi:MAG: alcohol dehydrogenase catalytic domain-containing protein, partial [Armatimonadota bacterium]